MPEEEKIKPGYRATYKNLRMFKKHVIWLEKESEKIFLPLKSAVTIPWTIWRRVSRYNLSLTDARVKVFYFDKGGAFKTNSSFLDSVYAEYVRRLGGCEDSYNKMNSALAYAKKDNRIQQLPAPAPAPIPIKPPEKKVAVLSEEAFRWAEKILTSSPAKKKVVPKKKVEIKATGPFRFLDV